jgi:hypothetical protein
MEGNQAVVRQHITAFAVAAVVVAGAGPGVHTQQAPAGDSEQARQRRWTAIENMENALEAAVRDGARNLSVRFQQMTGETGRPAGALLLSEPSAWGMPVPGYGMIFTVRVPGMNQTMVVAQSMIWRAGRETAPPPPVSPVDAAIDEWNGFYRDAVKDALIGAMLEDSGALRLGENESLTVGASRNRPSNPLDLSDRRRTVTFTVKGHVLQALQQKKIDVEQARKQVIVQED